jgi:predicted dithiol-disulfide oxidoreductase (DUF899 family)
MTDDYWDFKRSLLEMRNEKEYTFETDEGTKTLPELFDGRSQLLVFHFMFGPEDTEGCGEDYTDWPHRHDEYEDAGSGATG